jgi:hypothetical protein
MPLSSMGSIGPLTLLQSTLARETDPFSEIMGARSMLTFCLGMLWGLLGGVLKIF